MVIRFGISLNISPDDDDKDDAVLSNSCAWKKE